MALNSLELLDAQFTFVTPRLAQHYGLKAQGAGLQRYDLSKIPERGGLLTQGSILTVGGDEASMVTRGLFILHDLLRFRRVVCRVVFGQQGLC